MQKEGFHQLIVRAQSGDKAAIEELFTSIRPILQGRARQFADPARVSQSVSDLVQDTELQAWRSLETFCAGTGDGETLAMFRGWILQILRRLGINRHGHRGRKKRSPPGGFLVPLGRGGTGAPGSAGEPAGTCDPPGAHLIAQEEAERLRHAIERYLGPTDREIVRRRVVEGEPLTTIADTLGLEYTAVRQRYLSSLSLLEEKLGSVP